MYDVMDDIQKWVRAGEHVILATVIDTWGSSPRGVGAKMAFTPDGKITGSVSGGCIESAVFETGLDVHKSGHPRLLHFGVSDETAMEVGLACGGQIDVFVQKLDPSLFELMRENLIAGSASALMTVLQPEDSLGEQALFSEEALLASDHRKVWGKEAQALSRQAILSGEPSRTSLAVQTTESQDEEIEGFIDPILPPPTLILVGGAHISIALVAIARALGYKTIVVDPRRAFSSSERFPHADQIIQTWPQDAFKQIKLNRNTSVVLLTHDPKIDDPALRIVLESPVFYIGALGSKRTQANRRERLSSEGISEERLDRIHGPIGLDLGAKTPEEIALAIMSEIVAVRRGKAA
ncbi:MAG: XdhC family protein [Chloroflexi bacterium]|nr:MAG: XdhC family protein [Chloroflexota bacterium]